LQNTPVQLHPPAQFSGKSRQGLAENSTKGTAIFTLLGSLLFKTRKNAKANLWISSCCEIIKVLGQFYRTIVVSNTKPFNKME